MRVRAWDEDELNRMRNVGDPLADETVAELVAHFGEDQIDRAFAAMRRVDMELPLDAPAPLRRFVEATARVPSGTDLARIKRGAELFLDNATLAALALLAKSLPAGYASPRLTQILHFTGNLERHPYRRVLGVLQMLVNITQDGAFHDRGLAIVTGQKLRLLHAGVRRVVRSSFPAYAAKFDTPICQEDLVYTIVTFSHHVIEALGTFDVPRHAALAEDYFYLWRVYGELQGIRPEWMPQSLEEAAAFSEAYARRNFVEAKNNPEGLELTQADLRMMRELLPRWLRALGLGALPKLMMARLLGRDAAARVGVKRQPGHYILEWLLLEGPILWRKLWQHLTPSHAAHDAVSRLFFEALIKRAWKGEVFYTVPLTRQDLQKLA